MYLMSKEMSLQQKGMQLEAVTKVGTQDLQSLKQDGEKVRAILAKCHEVRDRSRAGSSISRTFVCAHPRCASLF